MRSKATKATAALLATGLFAFSSTALATNGYFTHGVGTESKGMGGAGVASPENMGAISVATNPALGIFSDESWQIGFAVFSPMRSYTTSEGWAQGEAPAFTLSQGSYDSDNEVFPIPYVAKNWKLSDDKAITGVFYGRGGMNTEWNGSQFARFDPFGFGPDNYDGVYGGAISSFSRESLPVAGVDLMQAFLSVNYSQQVSDKFAFGFGPVFAAQLFEATGLSAFAAYTQTYAEYVASGGDQGIPPWEIATAGTDNSSDMSTGYGFAVGFWGGTEELSFGLAYQTKMSMSELDDYSDLFAEGGGFDIPSTLKAGVSFKAGETTRINLDVEHIAYSDASSVHNPIANLLTSCFTANPAAFPSTDGCLGGPNGAGFGWDDMTVYKVGVEWASDENNTWRFGYSYGDQPIASSEVLFNILAPGVMEHHLTLGWTHTRPNDNILSMSLMYAPETTVSGQSTFDVQFIELKMKQLEFEIAYRF